MQHNFEPVQKCTKGSFGSPFSIHTSHTSDDTGVLF